MTKKIKAAIMKALEEYGVEPTSKGFTYIMDAVALTIEEHKGMEINKDHK